MSDLQAICDQVQSVAGEMKRWAGDVEAQASKIRRTASQAQATTKNSGPGNSVAPTLDAAARQCQQAAAALLSAQAAAGRFVATHGSEAIAPSVATTTGTDAGWGTGSRAGLDGKLQSIYDDESFAFGKGPGRFFLAPGDRFTSVAHTMPAPTDGSYLAMIHGSPDSVGVGNASLSPTEMADLIRNDPDYRSGQAVTLFSCSTGQRATGFAQQLADELGVTVCAPTSLAWLPPDPDGTPVVSPTDRKTGGPMRREDGSGYGGWRQFQPRGT